MYNYETHKKLKFEVSNKELCQFDCCSWDELIFVSVYEINPTIYVLNSSLEIIQ